MTPPAGLFPSVPVKRDKLTWSSYVHVNIPTSRVSVKFQCDTVAETSVYGFAQIQSDRVTSLGSVPRFPLKNSTSRSFCG